MANRVKEDEKNERIIRGLLKLSPNRHCINCNTLGPQYVCTNFWTFVCTICSGIHREFTHRVKSVSMAKFSSDEVSALQQGGNECAKEVYFKEWDFQLQSLPDSSNILRLRDFIKHVYVDRRYTGKRSVAKTTRVDRKDSYTEHNGSRRPPNGDTYEHCFVERFGSFGWYEERNLRYDYDARRGPGYDQDSQKHGRAHFEVVDDQFRDDRSGSRKSDDVRFSERVHKLESRSTNKQEALDTFKPPVVRPVRDILGDNSPTLRVGVPPKANGARASYGSANMQRTTSSSVGPTNENSVELKRANLGGLIDFNADPEHVPQPQQTSTSTCQSIAESTSLSSDNNWATFNTTTPEKVSPSASNSNAMDSLLSQSPAAGIVFKGTVSVLPAISGGLTANVNNMPTLPGAGNAAVSPASNMSSSLGVSALSSTSVASSFPISSGGDSSSKVNDTGQWTSMQQPQLSTFSVIASHCTQGSLSSPNLQSSQIVSKQTRDISSAVVSQSLPLEQKSRRRKELPEDLFTVTYSSVPGWQVVQTLSMACGMQNPSVAHVPAFRQPVKSTNPFDLNNEPNLGQAPMFPSMASLHGALPNVSAPTGLLRSSSLGSHSLQWLPPQSSHYVALPSQPLSYSPGIPSSAYLAQQIPRNQPPPGHQGVGAFGNSGVVFVNPNTSQQPGGIFSAPAISRSYSSVGGNPFG